MLNFGDWRLKDIIRNSLNVIGKVATIDVGPETRPTAIGQINEF